MTAADSSTLAHPRSASAWFWLGLKWSLFAAVIVFVGQRAYLLWEQDKGALRQVDVKTGWLVLAGIVYAIGWLPSVWFWRKLMQRLGSDVGYRDTARAYYCGQLGKYLPGKAAVLVIRSALMKERGAGAAVAAVTATFETLLMMGTGIAVGLALVPSLLTASLIATGPVWIQRLIGIPGLPAVIALTLLALSLPILSKLLTYVAVRLTPRSFLDGEAAVRIEPRLVAAGLLAFVVGWSIHGLSLGLTIRAISPQAFTLADWPLWIGSVSAATAIGFIAIFAPGGVGVREGLLIELLRVQPAIGPQRAVVAAVLLRAVWFSAEIVVSTTLYYTIRPVSAESRGNEVPDVEKPTRPDSKD